MCSNCGSSSVLGNVLGKRAIGHTRGGRELEVLSPIQEASSDSEECKTRDDELLRRLRQAKSAYVAKRACRRARVKYVRRILREHVSESIDNKACACERSTKISL
eukprot:TRINITY_DN5750_c0_g2_i1.p1 TRINITY_DN5750_c0_g2~~TRINITY_DN5750_c0_g2_i1.p1  ORF type:complete len:105 (+),score=6.11 TRINITY_DN5750_c0_g2_i1:119-433(+)